MIVSNGTSSNITGVRADQTVSAEDFIVSAVAERVAFGVSATSDAAGCASRSRTFIVTAIPAATATTEVKIMADIEAAYVGL